MRGARFCRWCPCTDWSRIKSSARFQRRGTSTPHLPLVRCLHCTGLVVNTSMTGMRGQATKNGVSLSSHRHRVMYKLKIMLFTTYVPAPLVHLRAVIQRTSSRPGPVQKSFQSKKGIKVHSSRVNKISKRLTWNIIQTCPNVASQS